MLIDKKFRLARVWSNKELNKFSHLFTGDIVNVSAWRDEDKQGGYYEDYFSDAKSYTITNFKTEARGLQGVDGELFLDLENDLEDNLIGVFDTVFNHTTLEHIYDFRKAFDNICLLSKDIVILVVPFLQEMHADYGDYWRFTPLALKRMFEENSMDVLYSSFNEDKRSSVYLFFIASKRPKSWEGKITNKFNYESRRKYFLDSKEGYVGCLAIKNSLATNILEIIKELLNKFRVFRG